MAMPNDISVDRPVIAEADDELCDAASSPTQRGLNHVRMLGNNSDFKKKSSARICLGVREW